MTTNGVPASVLRITASQKAIEVCVPPEPSVEELSLRHFKEVNGYLGEAQRLGVRVCSHYRVGGEDVLVVTDGDWTRVLVGEEL